VTSSDALVRLLHLLAERGIHSQGMTLTRRSGVLILAGGHRIGYSCGLYWWLTGRLRQDRPIYAIHPAADPAGAARRLALSWQPPMGTGR
jgi:hypothetical protein